MRWVWVRVRVWVDDEGEGRQGKGLGLCGYQVDGRALSFSSARAGRSGFRSSSMFLAATGAFLGGWL